MYIMTSLIPCPERGWKGHQRKSSETGIQCHHFSQ